MISSANYNDKIITIQKYIRGYLKNKLILIPQSCFQTKIWRKTRTCYKVCK